MCRLEQTEGERFHVSIPEIRNGCWDQIWKQLEFKRPIDELKIVGQAAEAAKSSRRCGSRRSPEDFEAVGAFAHPG
jgi:hypothetical protein